jgi:hypothetical protein
VAGHALLAARLPRPARGYRRGAGELPAAARPHLVGLQHLGEANEATVEAEVVKTALEATGGRRGPDTLLDGPRFLLKQYAANKHPAGEEDSFSVLFC